MSTRHVRVVKSSTHPISYSSSRPVITSRTVTSRPVISSRTVTTRPVVSRRVVTSSYPETSSYTSYGPGLDHHVTRTVSSRDPLTVHPRDTAVLKTSRENEYQTANPPNFTDLQKNMESQLENRRTDWEKEVEKMQQNFFNVKTTDAKVEDKDDVTSGSGGEHALMVSSTGKTPRSGSDILEIGNAKELFSESPDGTKIYRKRFDLSGFNPEDLSVRIEGNKLYISAKREEDFAGSKSTRDFKRTVDIPEAVDGDELASSLNDDGILTIEAPVDESKIPKKEEPKEHILSLKEALDPAFDNFGVVSPPGYSSVVRSSTYGGSSGSSPGGPNPRRFHCLEATKTPHGHKLQTDMYLGKKYKAEDITLKVYDDKIRVEAKSEDVVGGRTARRQFSRDVTLPEAVQRDSFRAMFGGDGKLYMGGSFVTNEDHDALLQSILDDMPADGKDCNVIF